MNNDPLIEEIHRVREENARKHNFDAQAMAQDFMRGQIASGHPVVNLHKPTVAQNLSNVLPLVHVSPSQRATPLPCLPGNE